MSAALPIDPDGNYVLSNEWIREQLNEPGYKLPSGGTIVLPEVQQFRAIDVYETLEIGDGSNTGSYPYFRMAGAGAAGVTNNGKSYGRSVLYWKGPPGEPMLRMNGCPYFHLQDFGLRLDGPNGVASCGVEVTADNNRGGVVNASLIERVHVAMDPQIANQSIGFVVTGAHRNDQVEVAFRDCVVNRLELGWLQDNAQAVQTELDRCEAYTTRGGLEIRNGSLTMRGGYLHNAWDPRVSGYQGDYIGCHLTVDPNTPNASALHASIDGVDFELRPGVDDEGQAEAGPCFVQIDSGTPRAYTLARCKLQLHGPQRFKLLETNSGSTVVWGNTVTTTANGSGFVLARGDGTLESIGNAQTPWTGPVDVEIRPGA